MADIATPQAWAREIAAKIHAHEAATIDETVEARSVELAALVRKSLAAIPASMKTAYLDELDTYFPLVSASSESVPSPTTARESAAAILRRRWSELSAAERDELLRLVFNSVFRDSHSSTRLGRLLLEAPRRGSPDRTPAPIDPERVLRLLEVFSEAVLGLQRLAIELWREAGARKLSGAPALASDADFRASIARCLTGDADVPPTMIEQEIERQRRAVAAAMAMLGPFAGNYAQAVLKPLSPESIAAQTGADSFSMFGSREAGYWKQYCRIWESLGNEQFEMAFNECLAKHLRSLNRTNP